MDRIYFNNIGLPTVIALTELEQMNGLSYHTIPHPIMSFPSELAVRKFWMKNTFVPLDIIFCRSGSIVSIEKGIPLSMIKIGPDEPTDLVVELPMGMAADLSLASNTTVKLSYGLFSLARKIEMRLTK